MSRAKTAQLLDTADPQLALRAAEPEPGAARPARAQLHRRIRRIAVRLAVLVAALGCSGLLGRGALAGEPEPLLFLGIQRSTTIDKLASQIIVEQLQERGETLLPTAGLTDTDRRCRRPQCLGLLASQRKAALVVDGDVQQVGQNRSLRIVMHLYDSRRRQQHEQENLCVDCDETKLGILLANTTTDLLVQYRKMDAAMDQLAALLDATPVAIQDRTPAAGKPAGSPAAVPPGPPASAPPSPPGPLASAPPLPPADATRLNPAGFLNEAPRQEPIAAPAPAPEASPAIPAPYALPPGSSALPPAGPSAYATPMPPLPLPLWDESPLRRPSAHRLSTKRRAIAGVLGGLGAGALAAAIILNVLDYRIASDRTYNPGGSPCVDPQYAGQNCVFSTVRLWAPGYGLGGLLLGSMILTLTLPERR